MTDRTRLPWRKLHVSWLTTPAHLELSGGALGLGPLLLLLATWDGEYDSGGWLLGEDGSPMSRDAMARAVHLTRTHLDRYLTELIRCRTLSLRESDGALGFAKFGRWQESRNAKYNRRKRAHQDAHSDVTVSDRGKTLDVRVKILPSGEPPLTPPPEGDSPAKPRKPTKPTKPRADYPEAFELELVEAFNAACKLARPPRRGLRLPLSPTYRDALRKLWAAEQPTGDDVRHVIAVRAALDHAGEGYGSLDLLHLCRAAQFCRYRERPIPSVTGTAKAWTPSDFGEETGT